MTLARAAFIALLTVATACQKAEPTPAAAPPAAPAPAPAPVADPAPAAGPVAVANPVPATELPPDAAPAPAGKAKLDAAKPKPQPKAKGADGAACSGGSDCASGECEGRGCGPNQGKCVARERMCTADVATMCDCHGETFTGSSSCPGRRYDYKGECKPKPGAALDACSADADCAIYFRTHACTPSDPLAINKSMHAAASQQYPKKKIACGMGGPQYECQARNARTRYTTECKAGTCQLVDHGVKPCD